MATVTNGLVRIESAIDTKFTQSGSMLLELKKGMITRTDGDKTRVESITDTLLDALETGVLTLQGFDEDGNDTERLMPLNPELWFSLYFRVLEQMEGKPAQIVRHTGVGPGGGDENSELAQWRTRSITIKQEAMASFRQNKDLYMEHEE